VCVAVSRSVLHIVSVLQWVAVSCSELQCVVVCCRVLQCVAGCCTSTPSDTAHHDSAKKCHRTMYI